MKKLLDMYLEANERHLDSSTVEMRIRCFNALMRFSRGPELTIVHIRKWQNSIIDSGLEKITANTYIKMVRPIYSWAVKEKLLESNPFNGIRSFKIPQKRIRFFDDRELDRLLKAAPNLRWRSLIMLARTTGLRRGECLSITVPDIDFDRMLVHVCAKKATFNTWPWHTKNYQRRTLPLADLMAHLLVQIIETLPNGQPYFHLTEKRYRVLLQRHLAGELPKRQQKTPTEHFGVPFQKIRERAGVDYGTFHDLRRSFITHLATVGYPPHETQKLAGHADLKTTMTYYVGIASDYTERARRLINASFDESDPQSSALPNCATPRKAVFSGLAV